MRHHRSVEELAVAVAAALRDHDPLDPWLSESHWDENYWDHEAERIAERLTPGMDAVAIRAVLVDVLGRLLASPADRDDQSQRLDRASQAIAAALE
jgi:hypothetical protein